MFSALAASIAALQRQAAGWIQTLSCHHLPQSGEFGTHSLVWRARRPLHPTDFKCLIEGDLPGVIRAKGSFWLATHLTWAASGNLSAAMATIRALAVGVSARSDSRTANM